MARQEILFAECISGVKKALLRKDEDSEMDSLGEPVTNRGNKLKRKAAFSKQGCLNNSENYKRRINFHGYSRNIINRNPPRLDADGDVVEEDEDDSEQDLTPAEDDPYAEVKIENLLMPLTHASDLRSHPSLSLPYTSRAIDQLILNAQDMLHKEQQVLWRIKMVFNQFTGDQKWVPCDSFQTEQDLAFMNQGASAFDGRSVAGSIDEVDDYVGRDVREGMLDVDHEIKDDKMLEVDDVEPADARSTKETAQQDDLPAPATQDFVDGQALEVDTKEAESILEVDTKEAKPTTTNDDSRAPAADENNTALPTLAAEAEADPEPESHPMTTRTRAAALAAPPSPSLSLEAFTLPSSPSLTTTVHPLFTVPSSVLPARDLGLPPLEADDTRRLLYAYVQRQEEVVRGVVKLLNGLIKAQRLRETVLEWCDAEGHVGECSDGEDWVDEKKWELDVPLGKGEDVEEEEEVRGKKSRRRAGA